MEMVCQLHAPAALALGEIPITHCTGGWVGPRAGLGRCGEEKNIFPATDVELRTVKSVASCSTERRGLLSDYKCRFHTLGVFFSVNKLYALV
jgi:hypothetical protein